MILYQVYDTDSSGKSVFPDYVRASEQPSIIHHSPTLWKTKRNKPQGTGSDPRLILTVTKKSGPRIISSAPGVESPHVYCYFLTHTVLCICIYIAFSFLYTGDLTCFAIHFCNPWIRRLIPDFPVDRY